MHSFTLDVPFQLDLSVSCGQSFRWRKINGFWYAPVGDSIWKLRQSGNTLYYEGVSETDLTHYLALDVPLEKILSSVDTNNLIHSAILSCRGLRILRQPPFECLISYICATCANIPSIRLRVETLSRTYGTELEKDGLLFYTFPTPSSLENAEDLRCCKVGYRDTYIRSAVAYVQSHPSWISHLQSHSYKEAQKELMTILGVGPKVADCVLLFAFEKYESVPIDVWIGRIFRTLYFHSEKKLPYNTASDFAREHFGSYAGYAQEYLFAEREILSKKGE